MGVEIYISGCVCLEVGGGGGGGAGGGGGGMMG